MCLGVLGEAEAVPEGPEGCLTTRWKVCGPAWAPTLLCTCRMDKGAKRVRLRRCVFM